MTSTRAEIVTRRTYNRPKADDTFETWDETIDRVIDHQKWLWERAKTKRWHEQTTPLTQKELDELEELRVLFKSRKALPSGRTLWLGGTEVAKRREASMFNCSFLRVESVHDVVDAYWLLLQGCGVGFEPVTGTLNGFTRPVELEVIRSPKSEAGDKGNPDNVEWFTEGHLIGPAATVKGAHWHIRVGDSAEAWAKLPGKLLANKMICEKLTLDFSEIRPAGTRLSSYGWISSGDELIADAMTQIVRILNLRNNRLLTRIDIMDILNLLGSTLSSRRSAEICLVPYGDPEWVQFVQAKAKLSETPWRTQSNNSLLFYHRPSRRDLGDIFEVMMRNGGSEPGLINAQAAMKRAPWFKGVNPCAEILLGSKSFCNLTEINLAAFNCDFEGLKRAAYLVGRCNYRQTCVVLTDGLLQRAWHENNEFLRLCGVGLTGIVSWDHYKDGKALKAVRNAAGNGTTTMAQELRLPMPKLSTTVKPSGTLSKIMDTTEGVHRPLGRYIFNNIKFSVHDPIVAQCKKAGYRVFDDPYNKDAVLVTFPVSYDDVEFDLIDGKEVNVESAIDQLERYKYLMEQYVEHNCSITVSYSPEEVPGIIDWLLGNWELYVGVSFLFRNDPTKTAEDLGYAYLPQEVVTKEVFDTYVQKLKKLKLVDSLEEILDDECATGACPIR